MIIIISFIIPKLNANRKACMTEKESAFLWSDVSINKIKHAVLSGLNIYSVIRNLPFLLAELL